MTTVSGEELRQLIERIEIPKMGAYFMAGGVKFHINVEGQRVVLRCVETPDGRGERLFSHQPSANVFWLEAQ